MKTFKNSIFISITLLLTFFLLSPIYAQPLKNMSIEKRIEYLQKEIDELKKLLKEQNEKKEKSLRLKRKKVVQVKPTQIFNTNGIKVSFGGQYRINFYSAHNEKNNILNGNNDQRAARLRIRQNIDFQFNNKLKTHLQIELQHVTDNVTTTDLRLGNKSTNLSIRHAVIRYMLDNGSVLKAGILPLHDYFHDVLFSSDWDYNPLAVSFICPVGKGRLRIFSADLKEGEEDISQDDFLHYQIDYKFKIGQKKFVFSSTFLNLQNDPSYGKSDSWHYNYGFSYSFPIKYSWIMNGFLMGSYTEKELLGTKDDANGIAMLMEFTGKLGKGKFGFLISHATGDKNGTGFLPPMAFSKTFGYWGYTGILTVQGPTDTGFDFDAVNISNNGLGLTTIQSKYCFSLNKNLSLYMAGGWFGNTHSPDRRKSQLGIDLLLMGIYKFNNFLQLDMGLAYAHLEDSVSGYENGVQNRGKPLFNQYIGKKRDKIVTFGRLQLEF